MPKLTIRTGEFAGREYDFREGSDIGRSPQASLHLEDRTLSRRHATFTRTSTGWQITDLGSANGTFVNGRRLSAPARITDGDEIKVGNVVLEFRTPEAAPSPAPLPKAEESSVIMLDQASHSVISRLKASESAGFLSPTTGAKALEKLKKRLELVSDVSRAVAQELDENILLPKILEKVFDVFPQADRGFILLHDADTGKLIPKAGKTRSGAPSAFAISKTLVGEVIKNRQGILSVDAAQDERFAANVSIHALGIRPIVCVPMMAGEEVFGVLTLDSASTIKAFDADDMALILGIAGQAALAVANARLHQRLVGQELIKRDLGLARRIQTRFVPKHAPEIEGFQFGTHYAPALEVGGDYLQYLDMPEPWVGVSIGDVSGKGISAALYMVKVSTEVRTRAAGQSDPGEILARVNRAISDDLVEDGMFVTAIVAALNTETRQLRIASAGHPAPLVRREDGSILQLPVPRNTPLGVAEDATFPPRSFQLLEGDVALLYTDGLSESMSSDGTLFGEDRIVDVMSAAEGTVQGVLSGLLLAVDGFVGSAPQNDDLTLVCFGPTPGETGGLAGGTHRLEPVRD